MSQSLDISHLESLPIELLYSILMNLDYRDILKLCQVSTRLSWVCQDWSFWADKAWRKFEFPRDLFNQTAQTDPRKRFQEVQEYYENPNWPLIDGAIRGQFDLVKYSLSHGADDLVYAMAEAANNGHDNLMRYLMSQIPPDNPDTLKIALAAAARGGHSDLVKYLLSLDSSTSNLDEALEGAAQSHNLDLVNELISLGATDLNLALLEAARKGSIDIMLSLLSHGATDLKLALRRAATSGNLNVIQYFINPNRSRPRPQSWQYRYSGINVMEIITTAIDAGHLPIVKYLVEQGHYDLNKLLRIAANRQRLDIVKYLIGQGANDIQGARTAATEPNPFFFLNRPDAETKQQIIDYLESLLHPE